MNRRISLRPNGIGAAALALLAATALLAAACGGTSNADKTSTAAAKGGSTAAATSAATKPAATSTTAASTSPAASGSPTAGAATGTAVLKITTDPTLGKFFTDDKGFTLYIFKNDVAGNGKSAAEALTAVWPPLTSSAPPTAPTGATGAFAIITRVDGKKQVTYNGLPLYYFANDKAAGDTKGQAVANVWFVAAP
jgi:predicted lipoprotein with Yx(FWY)xxD motif